MIKLKESGEMYLETIIILSEQLENVRSIDIAEYMDFSKPSVSRAISILKDDGYINVDNKGHITLTSEGEAIAKAVYERHVVLGDLFVALGIEESVAHADACKIEHDISDETFEALKVLLNKLQNENK